MFPSSLTPSSVHSCFPNIGVCCFFDVGYSFLLTLVSAVNHSFLTLLSAVALKLASAVALTLASAVGLTLASAVSQTPVVAESSVIVCLIPLSSS